jgi:uncharacterized protein YjiS (DUF1127 family)
VPRDTGKLWLKDETIMTPILQTLDGFASAKFARRHPGNRIVRLHAAFARAMARRAARLPLHTLDDFLLRDIGITRCDIECAIRGKMYRRRTR